MYIGFDYGTANCSIAVMENNVPRLLPLENQSLLLPSMLCAPARDAVSEWLYRHHQVPTPDKENLALLRRSIHANRENDIEVKPDSIQFGRAALKHYMADPDDTWFVKSPKSFLGSSGLKPAQIVFFEDLICAMMLHIRQQAEGVMQTTIDQAVIGRPVNFQGLGSEEANRQAEGVLQRAAIRAGFKEVAFQFEPVAAGLDYEATLSRETRVLVVDIGGGTTDCSMLLMGPRWWQKTDRTDSLVGHSGCRVGGNDLDIMLAFKQLMPLLGAGGETHTGHALPALQWWNAVAINDVPAQNDFYASGNRKCLEDLVRDAKQPEKVQRLVNVWQQRLSNRLVQVAEESKIALSERRQTSASLPFIEQQLATSMTQQDLALAIRQPLERMRQQIDLALASSETCPEVVYLTGGSARSPLLRAAVSQILPDTPLVSGDDFTSVTAGLARWAQTLFGR
ncbi:molecular chaperone [Izhakiella capsodis]|nr:molecular chaperone [Izhakiella capsodis]